MARSLTVPSLVSLTLALLPLSTHSQESKPEERKYLLDRVEDAAVVQVYADAFEKLPLNQKLLAYHLYEAAIAGRDIYYDQRYAHNLDMRATPSKPSSPTPTASTPTPWPRSAATPSSSGSTPAPSIT